VKEKYLRVIIRENIKNIIEYQNLFLEQNSLTMSYTKNYIHGNINESEYIKFLNTINESNFFEEIKIKALNSLLTFLKEAAKIGFKIFDKLKTLINWVWGKIKSFKEKNPVLFKVIVITLLVMIILILSASTAHAQTNGSPIPENQINTAIGYIKDMQEHSLIKNTNNMDINKAIAYLIKLRDAHGVTNPDDVKNFGEESLRLANGGIKAAEAYIKDARTEGQNSQVYNYCLYIMDKGSDFISYSIQKFGSSETVRLGIK